MIWDRSGDLGKFFEDSNNASFQSKSKVKTLHHTSFAKYLPIFFSRLSNWEN